MDSHAITIEEAHSKWSVFASERLDRLTCHFVRTMGLPVECWGGWPCPSPERVRQHLLASRDLREAVRDQVRHHFFRAVDRGLAASGEWCAASRGLVWSGEHADGWLYRATQWTTWRLATRHAKELLSHLDADNQALACHELLPDEQFERTRHLRRLRGLIEGLTEEERRVLGAKLEGTYRETALELGLPESTVRSRAFRLIGRLRSELCVINTGSGDEAA